MPIRTWTPTSGRLRLDGSAFLLSVTGRPVAGSRAGTTLTSVPQSAPPQRAIRVVPPSSARHSPIGSAVAGPMPAIMPIASTPLQITLSPMCKFPD